MAKTVTPVGTALYIWANKPNKDNKYSMDLILSGASAKKFTKEIDQVFEDTFSKVKRAKAKKPYVELKGEAFTKYTTYTDEDGAVQERPIAQYVKEGDFKFSFTNKPSFTGKDGDEVKIRIGVFDAKAKPLPNDIIVGNGSKVIVDYATYPWEFKGKEGLSLRLNNLQVVEMQLYEGGSGGGFEAVEGYTYDGEAAEAPKGKAEEEADF